MTDRLCLSFMLYMGLEATKLLHNDKSIIRGTDIQDYTMTNTPQGRELLDRFRFCSLFWALTK